MGLPKGLPHYTFPQNHMQPHLRTVFSLQPLHHNAIGWGLSFGPDE